MRAVKATAGVCVVPLPPVGQRDSSGVSTEDSVEGNSRAFICIHQPAVQRSRSKELVTVSAPGACFSLVPLSVAQRSGSALAGRCSLRDCSRALQPCSPQSTPHRPWLVQQHVGVGQCFSFSAKTEAGSSQVVSCTACSLRAAPCSVLTAHQGQEG